MVTDQFHRKTSGNPRNTDIRNGITRGPPVDKGAISSSPWDTSSEKSKLLIIKLGRSKLHPKKLGGRLVEEIHNVRLTKMQILA
jgi:hypothetical protein